MNRNSNMKRKSTLGSRVRRWALWTGGGVVLLALLIQFVPYGRQHNNPPVASEPNWDSPQTQALFMRACGDCHSNQTTWPWYSNVAPISWLVQNHVDEGRERFNVSDLAHSRSDEAAETVQRGTMPPGYYTVIHPSAKLSTAEQQALLAGLMATFGGEGRAADVVAENDD